jgi:hypothetical protein
MATASLRIDLDGKDVAALATLGLLAEASVVIETRLKLRFWNWRALASAR